MADTSRLSGAREPYVHDSVYVAAGKNRHQAGNPTATDGAISRFLLDLGVLTAPSWTRGQAYGSEGWEFESLRAHGSYNSKAALLESLGRRGGSHPAARVTSVK